jgi:hypothetical protein
VALCRELGDQVGLAHALACLGLQHVLRGDSAGAAPLLTEVMAVATALNDPFTLSTAYLDLGQQARADGRFAEAATLLAEAVQVGRTINRPTYRAFSVTQALVFQGRAEAEGGDPRRARDLFAEALTTMREWGLAGPILGNCLDGLAGALDADGSPSRSALLIGAADAQWRRAGARRLAFDRPAHEQLVAGARAALGNRAYDAAWSDGRALPPERVLSAALEAAHAGPAAPSSARRQTQV